VSTKNRKTLQKITALTSTKADIILMSDMRLNSLIQKAAVNDVSKKLEFSGYDFWHNSPFASRGVGIAIKKSLGLCSKHIHNDRTGNIIALELTKKGDADERIIINIVSIYGPNDNNAEFYSDLDNILHNLTSDKTILCGDWNSTWDSSPPETNIDVLNMRSLPSIYRTNRVLGLAGKYGLIEPYRYFYPNRKDFTYIPNAAANTNRSRLDYFLVSETLTNMLSDAGVLTEKLSTLFDHKTPVLEMGVSNKKPDRNLVCDSILNNKIVELVVELTVKENYLNNADPDTIPRYTVNTLRSEIGRIHNRLASATNLELSAIKNNNLNNVTKNEIEELIKNAIDISETIPDLSYFENLPLGVPPDIFFEGLILSVKNEILSKQSTIYKIKNFRKKILRDRIWQLKQNYNQNFAEISRQENILNSLVEEELREKLSKYKVFERINQEKITPYFMNLVKNDSKSDCKINTIRDDTGTPFETDNSREEFITNFYRNLYTDPKTEQITGNSIGEFLGDVAAHPEVNNSKLNDDEKASLDTDILIDEFDKAVTQIKLNSSPGIDGLSNKFIKKYWNYFRVPLHNYTIHCLTEGRLTENFRVAKIRLIPKKTDPKKISNWRPISLLNCFYKIVSRVLTNRLIRVSDKITKIGQKGYSKSKWCQEVAITLFDSIADCKTRQKSGCIVSLDIKKAFDSISHDFIKQALRFFNFGEKFISWVMTICTNRKACIITGTGKTGPTFDLERGNAQGDVISPFLFNICYQVLLLKIELSLQIESIGLPNVQLEDGDLIGAANVVSHRSKKVFAFADDCNILAACKPETIREIVRVLNDFGKISGLECNVQKSHILPIGHLPVITDEIRDLGFSIVQEMTVLGFEISNDPNILRKNAETIRDKIIGQYRIWSRYNLSLPGRINIAKTMMYSQLNYKGCVIPVPDDIITAIEDVIHGFVSGKLNVAKDRCFKPINLGGLGLFDVKNFLDAQTCSWIRRTRTIDQDWKARLVGTGTGNIYTISCENIEGNQYPITHNIARAFDSFRAKFSATGNNYKLAYVINNQSLTIGVRTKQFLTTANIESEANLGRDTIRALKNIKISDLVLNGQKISKPVFCRNIGGNISADLWQKLDKIRNAALLRYGSDDYLPVKTLEQFMTEWKKGSKKIRMVLTRSRIENIPHNMVKFADNTETVIGINLSKYLNSLWSRGYLSNTLRVFLFKLHNNTLPVNTILSHFVRNVGRNCTFCDVRANPEIEDETVFHIFYSCTVSENIRTRFYDWLTNGTINNVSRREFFGTFKENNNNLNEFLNITTRLFQKYLWDSKIKKCLPALEGLKNFITDEILVMTKVSIIFKRIISSTGLNLEQILGIRF
jgi:exonuclease III